MTQQTKVTMTIIAEQHERVINEEGVTNSLTQQKHCVQGREGNKAVFNFVCGFIGWWVNEFVGWPGLW